MDYETYGYERESLSVATTDQLCLVAMRPARDTVPITPCPTKPHKRTPKCDFEVYDKLSPERACWIYFKQFRQILRAARKTEDAEPVPPARNYTKRRRTTAARPVVLPFSARA